MQYPHGTILNSNSDSTHKKLPENIYFFGVPNILPEPDPGRLWVMQFHEIFVTKVKQISGEIEQLWSEEICVINTKISWNHYSALIPL